MTKPRTGKYMIYIRAKNEEIWKRIGGSSWINKKLEEDGLGLPPDSYDYDETTQKWVEPRD